MSVLWSVTRESSGFGWRGDIDCQVIGKVSLFLQRSDAFIQEFERFARRLLDSTID